MQSTIDRLQRWYQNNCDGEWEEQFGVAIGTLDNPGWEVRIDLSGTSLERAKFEEVSDHAHPTDWIVCRVQDGKFEGFGGPSKLECILTTFLDWAEGVHDER